MVYDSNQKIFIIGFNPDDICSMTPNTKLIVHNKTIEKTICIKTSIQEKWLQLAKKWHNNSLKHV